MSVPWYMLSPSPVSLIQYAVLTWFGSRFLLRRIEFKYPRIMSLVQSFMVVAFFVVLTDSFWAGFQAFKFIPMYPQDALQIITSFGRDVAAAFLFFMLVVGDYFKNGVLSFDAAVISGLLSSLLMQMIWFMLSPSPAYTDYTFAWRHGYPLDHILKVWFISHWVMRLPLWVSIIAAFKHGKKPKPKEETKW